jgi:tetratricopeptide (TPR) repeat protein
LEQDGRTAEALRHYRSAINAQSDFAPARLALGRLLAKTGDREGAVAEIRAALRARPNWPEAEAALAAVLQPYPGAEEPAP